MSTTIEKAVYYLSDRPEAYEVWAEVSQEEAKAMAQLIAQRAGQHFPDIEFLIDGDWHAHQRGMEHVASVIEENWQTWVEEGVTK